MTDRSAPPVTVRSLGDGDVGLWLPFEHKDRAKALPGARWDKHLRCWRVPMVFAAEARALADELNGRHRTRAAGAVAVAPTLDALLGAVPVALRQATYKALARAWHPDAGGDTALMQALNAAWERIR